MPSPCALFAVLDDNSTVRVGKPSTDWHLIQRRHARYDERLFYGARKQTVGGKLVKYFAVRDLDDPDPRWQGAIPVRCADVRLVPDRPHRIVVSGTGRAFVVNERGIANSTQYKLWGDNLRTAPDIFKAISRARVNARRAGLI